MPTNPQLVVFAGLPGTGKTTLARAVARALPAAYLSKATIKTCALRLAREMKIEQGQDLAGPLSYELLVDLARDNLTLGLPVILDSPAGYRVFREKVEQVSRNVKADIKLIECICTDESMLRQRVADRGRDLPPRAADGAAYQREREQFEKLTGPRLIVDTAEALALNVRKVLAYLGRPPFFAETE